MVWQQYALSVLGFLGLLLLVTIIINAFKKPSDFARGIALSIIRNPAAWFYKGGEYWLYNDDAALAICTIASFETTVETTQPVNRGSKTIAKFQSADYREFRKAYEQWLQLTAVERQMISDKRKREALVALDIAT